MPNYYLVLFKVASGVFWFHSKNVFLSRWSMLHLGCSRELFIHRKAIIPYVQLSANCGLDNFITVQILFSNRATMEGHKVVGLNLHLVQFWSTRLHRVYLICMYMAEDHELNIDNYWIYLHRLPQCGFIRQFRSYIFLEEIFDFKDTVKSAKMIVIWYSRMYTFFISL